VKLTFADPAGAWYGALTLRQLARQFREAPARLPHRGPSRLSLASGVMLDVSRDKVPTLETPVSRLAEELAELKYNRLELYTEHTFAYRHHREVWAEASPLTGEDIRALDAFLRGPLHRAGAQPEFLRPYAPLAQASRYAPAGRGPGRLPDPVGRAPRGPRSASIRSIRAASPW
jgi:hexosaminidase